MSIKRMCLDKALAFLKAAGADYVVTFEGELFESEVPIVAEESEPPKAKRKQINKFEQDTGYIFKVNALQIGDVLVFERGEFAIFANNNHAWSSFRASINSQCRRKFGPGNCVIRSDQKKLEILRAQ